MMKRAETIDTESEETSEEPNLYVTLESYIDGMSVDEYEKFMKFVKG